MDDGSTREKVDSVAYEHNGSFDVFRSLVTGNQAWCMAVAPIMGEKCVVRFEYLGWVQKRCNVTAFVG